MKIQRFFATTVSAALSEVRETLGSDAIIISNRNILNGVEILATREDDLSSVIAESVAEPASPPTAKTPPALEKKLQKNTPETASADPLVKRLFEEIRDMRSYLERRPEPSTTTEAQPIQRAIFGELLAMGFSASLARYLIANVPSDSATDLNSCLQWVKDILLHNVITLNNEEEFLGQGGIYALVGPTGIGKTTTIAKLAARLVLRHGANKLALVNTDSYRIGAPEQVRIYGKILGISVHPVQNEAELKFTLESLKDKHTILIDTVGMSQRDQMITEQLGLLSNTKQPIKRLLCLNATSSIDTLNEIVEAYRGSELAGCILTKLDEAVTISNVLEVLLRHKLKLFYVASGQRVPEDLDLAGREKLINQAFEYRHSRSSTRLKDHELSLIMN
jgi:flagellar biosynthesis protein FlhF